MHKGNNYTNSSDNNENVNTNNNVHRSHHEQGGKKFKDIDWN